MTVTTLSGPVILGSADPVGRLDQQRVEGDAAAGSHPRAARSRESADVFSPSSGIQIMTITDPRVTAVPADGEVVTHASTRLVRALSPGSARSVTVALITLDNGRDRRRPNTFGPLGLAGLDAAITTAIAAAPDAIAVTGKPGSFAAGADLAQLVNADDSPLRSSRHLGTGSSAGSRPKRSPRSRSSTGSPWAAAWNWPCTAATGSSPPTPPHSGTASGVPRDFTRLERHTASPADLRT